MGGLAWLLRRLTRSGGLEDDVGALAVEVVGESVVVMVLGIEGRGFEVGDVGLDRLASGELGREGGRWESWGGGVELLVIVCMFGLIGLRTRIMVKQPGWCFLIVDNPSTRALRVSVCAGRV